MIKYKVGIIGCGLIGNKRAIALEKHENSRLHIVADTNASRSKELGTKYKCKHTEKWQNVINDPEVNIVFISTTHDKLAQVTIAALRKGKHVLVEKPGGKNSEEVRKIIDEYEKHKGIKVKVGFNHRFHPSFFKAKEIIRKENIGEIMFIRARYGHGGRINYEKEWRASKEISGGGELLDQGSHIIDLARYFLGDFTAAIGFCDTYFWDMEVEDNCFALLRTKKGQTAQLHASWTEWKNSFAMDIMCKTGQISINGLGRSYGKEKLIFYRMKPEMGVPDRLTFEWDGEDNSWEKEYGDFIYAIENNQEPNGDIYDAYKSLLLIENIYSWSEKNKDYSLNN